MKEMPDTVVLPPPCLPPLQQQPSWKPTAPLKRGLRDTRIHKAFTRAIRLEYVSLFVSLSLSRSLSVSVLSLPLSLSPARHPFLPTLCLSLSAFLSVSLSVPVSLSLVISLDLFFSSPYSLYISIPIFAYVFFPNTISVYPSSYFAIIYLSRTPTSLVIHPSAHHVISYVSLYIFMHQ